MKNAYRNKLFPSELDYFRANQNVAGMASESGHVILNPNSPPHINRDAVAKNEAFRLYLRKRGIVPNYELSGEQIKAFSGTSYGDNEGALKATIAARIYSGDPSAKATPEQIGWVKNLMSEK